MPWPRRILEKWYLWQMQNEVFSAATGLETPVWRAIAGSQVVALGNGTQVTEQSTRGKLSYSECDEGAYVSYFLLPQ